MEGSPLLCLLAGDADLNRFQQDGIADSMREIIIATYKSRCRLLVNGFKLSLRAEQIVPFNDVHRSLMNCMQP